MRLEAFSFSVSVTQKYWPSLFAVFVVAFRLVEGQSHPKFSLGFGGLGLSVLGFKGFQALEIEFGFVYPGKKVKSDRQLRGTLCKKPLNA